jgi:hypothetical protein
MMLWGFIIIVTAPEGSTNNQTRVYSKQVMFKQNISLI